MFRRLPPVLQFIFVSLIGILLGTVVGLANEFLQYSFNVSNALIWLFLLIVSAGIVTLITLYGRNVR